MIPRARASRHLRHATGAAAGVLALLLFAPTLLPVAAVFAAGGDDSAKSASCGEIQYSGIATGSADAAPGTSGTVFDLRLSRTSSSERTVKELLLRPADASTLPLSDVSAFTLTAGGASTAGSVDGSDVTFKGLSISIPKTGSADLVVTASLKAGATAGALDLLLPKDALKLEKSGKDKKCFDTAFDPAASVKVVAPTDAIAPVLSLPANVGPVEGDAVGGAKITYTPTASDAVDGAVAPSCAPASGSVFTVGTTTVACTATDMAGNKASGTFTITVKDTTTPTISGMPSAATLDATGAAGAIHTWNAPTATDVVDGSVAVSCAPASGSTFATGDTAVVCSATDAAGNVASARFAVSVRARGSTIRITPSSAALAPGESVRLSAVVLDASGTPVTAPVEWEILTPALGTLNGGEFLAGTQPGAASIAARSGSAKAQAVVYISDTRAASGTVAEVQAAAVTREVEGVATTALVAGISSAEAGAAVKLTIDKPLEAGVSAATATLETSANALALVIEAQQGSATIVPDEVDLASLRSLLSAPDTSDVPGLFITVQAVIGSKQVSSTGLNALLGTLDVEFQLPASYFDGSGLDPAVVRLIEYSDGVLVRADIGATLLTPTPVQRAYSYRVILEQFSSFAVVAAPAPAPPPPRPPSYLAGLSVSGEAPTVMAGGSLRFSAVAHDQYGNVLGPRFGWGASCGSMQPDGTFLAPTTAGVRCTLEAVALGVRGTAQVEIVPGLPTDIEILAPHSIVLPGSAFRFQASGVDAYGNPVAAPQWVTTCGRVSHDGTFTAPGGKVQCTVTAIIGWKHKTFTVDVFVPPEPQEAARAQPLPEASQATDNVILTSSDPAEAVPPPSEADDPPAVGHASEGLLIAARVPLDPLGLLALPIAVAAGRRRRET